MTPSILARLGGLALVAVLAGCAGAPTRIHTLEPTAAPDRVAWPGPAFRVDAVHIPPAYDRPEVVRRSSPYTVTLSDRDRWAAPLGDLVRRTLTQDLAARLPPGAVIFPDAPKPTQAQGLVVDILSIASGADGMVMEASWTWLPPREAGAAAPRPPLSATMRTPGLGGSPQALAPELSTLLGQLADAIVGRPAAVSQGRVGRGS